MKMKTKKILSALLATVYVSGLVTVPSFAAETAVTEVATYEALVEAIGEGNDVKLIADITATGAVDGKDTTIDLGGNKLTLTVGGSNFFGESVISNGTIDITGCVASGDCIIGIGDYSNDATLTLNNVNVTGDGYSSAYAVLYVYGSSTLNINGGSIVVSNDNASAGGVIKAHSAANGKINITGTESDPVELAFTDAKIGILDGTVVMDYVDLDITGGANAINQSALTVKNSTLTIKDCDGRALTLSDGDVTIENSTLDFSGATEGEIRFKKALTLNVDDKSTITSCDIYTDVDGAKVNDIVVTGTEKNMNIVTAENGNVTIKAVPTGSNSMAYTKEVDGYVRVWGEGRGNASESYELKLYSGETLIATTKLNNVNNIIDGDVEVTWNFYYPESNDDFWTTTWEAGHPNSAAQPTHVDLIIDGTVVATTQAKMSGADNVNPVEWEELGGVRKVVTGLSGSGTEEDPYLINNLEELKWFRDDVNTFRQDGTSQYTGKYIKLTSDINLDEDGDGIGEEWEPIGSTAVDHGSFYGTFDGDGHIISNLVVSEHGAGSGFFAKTSGGGDGSRATVKNIIFNNVDVNAGNNSSYAGGVIANSGGNTVVDNVHVTGNVYINGYGYVGGIVGHGYPKINNCSVKAEDGSYVHANYWCGGGIIGYAGEGGTKITECSVEGIDVWANLGAAAAVAGLLQYNNTITDVSAKNVEITSNSDYCMGYIAGNGEESTLTNISVENVTSTANGKEITSTDVIAKVGTAIYFDFAEAVEAAKDGDTVTILKDGTYTLPSTIASKITIEGVDKEGVIIDFKGTGNQTVANVTDITFKNLTIKHNNVNYSGFYESTAETYDNCIINGVLWSYATTAVYNDCTFNQTENDYNIWVYGSGTVTITNCTFNCNTKSVLIYNEGYTGSNVNISGCTFTASNGANDKAAVEIDSSFLKDGKQFIINISDSTATGFGTETKSGSPLWNEKKESENAVVKVDSEQVWPIVAPELPTATVTDITEAELKEGGAPDLTFAKKFKAVTPEEPQKTYYGDWYADYVLTVNKDVTFNANGEADGYLAGSYQAWSNGAWVSVPFEDVTLKAGESLKIMEYAAKLMGQPGLKVTYSDVLDVNEFNCGIFFDEDFLAANPDLEVKLELRMYNPKDESESYVIGETYTFVPEEKEELSIFGSRSFFKRNKTVTDADGNITKYQVILYAGIDSDKYDSIGFEVYGTNDGGATWEIATQAETTEAWNSISGYDPAKKKTVTYDCEDIGSNVVGIFGYTFEFDPKYKDYELRYRPFARLNGEKIRNDKLWEIPKIYDETLGQ